MFFQQLINGLSIGSIYALMAVGYSLIYSLLNFTNFAHSITVTIGAFCAFFFLSQLVQNLFLGILIAVLAAGGLAMLIELLGYRPLLKKKARRIYLLITGLGISTMCENLIIISFSSRFRVYPVNFSNESINLFGASVGQVDLIIFVVSITALVLGGLGSIPGAVLGAITLGIGETMISSYISSSMRDIFAYALLVIVLFVRPSGLMGKATEDKA